MKEITGKIYFTPLKKMTKNNPLYSSYKDTYMDPTLEAIKTVSWLIIAIVFISGIIDLIK